MNDGARIVTVVVDNDFPVVIAGLRAMLSRYDDRIRVVDAMDDQLEGPPPGIVLKDAFAFDQDLAAYCADSRARVVLFAASAEEAAIEAALSCGASGYIHKGVSDDRLVSALLRVSAGERVVEVDRAIGEDVHGADWPGREQGLTERESEVLGLICRGLSNQQVAQTLFLSINSVKTYIRTTYRKIGAESRSQAVIWGIQHGFTPVTR